MRPATRVSTVAGEEKCSARNGAHPAREVETRLLGVRTVNAEEREMVCVLLLPGRTLKNAAGTGDPAALETPETGLVTAGRMSVGLERAGRTGRPNAGGLETDGMSDDRRVRCQTRPKAHLTVASAASEASPLHAGLGTAGIGDGR